MVAIFCMFSISKFFLALFTLGNIYTNDYYWEDKANNASMSTDGNLTSSAEITPGNNKSFEYLDNTLSNERCEWQKTIT